MTITTPEEFRRIGREDARTGGHTMFDPPHGVDFDAYQQGFAEESEIMQAEESATPEIGAVLYYRGSALRAYLSSRTMRSPRRIYRELTSLKIHDVGLALRAWAMIWALVGDWKVEGRPKISPSFWYSTYSARLGPDWAVALISIGDNA